MRSAFLLLCFCLNLPADTLYRIACGTGGTDPQRNVWTPAAYSGGAVWTAANQPAMSSLPVPYNSLRYSSPPGAPFTYTLAVPPGDYTVTLKLVEPNKSAAGQRLFNVSAQGLPALTSFDVFSEATAALTPYDETFPVSALSGQILLTFSGVTGNAVVSGIQIDGKTPEAPQDGVRIKCQSGIVSAIDLTAAARIMEIPILTDIPGNTRWEQVIVSEHKRFQGTTDLNLTVSMGRPGGDATELTGALIQLAQSGGDAIFWSTRPIPPVVTENMGPYSVVLSFISSPGNVNTLTAGEVRWEACTYPGPSEVQQGTRRSPSLVVRPPAAAGLK